MLHNGRPGLQVELATYAASTTAEVAMVAQMREFLAAHDNAFERTTPAGHVTGSAWIVDRAGSAAVLIHHRKLGKWLQLGGHADGDRNVRRVALREAREESGLTSLCAVSDAIFDIDVHAIPAREREPAHLHFDVRFAFFADPAETPHANAESHAVAWVRLAQIERYAIDDSVRRLVAKTPSLVASVS